MEDRAERRRRRLPHGSTTSVIPEWAWLPPELVERVADCVLSTTGGVDAYMDMRAVCTTWRSAIAKPSPLAAFTDLRFRPRHWVMMDMTSDNHDDDARLFLHVPTGRFCWLRLPALIDHALFGASDGLLVLADRVPPYHRARVLNPFTGDMLHLDAPSPQHARDYMVYTSVDGEGARCSTLVLLRWGSVFCAAPTSHIFTEVDYVEEDFDAYLVSVVNFRGNAYCADTDGHVLKFVAPAAAAAERRDDELVVIAQVSPGEDLVHPEGDDTDDMCSYLVDSAGELLLVRYFHRCFKVFRVDLERKLLEKVTSLGGHRALFLGEDRCFSVDVDKLPSVDGDCIYMFDFKERFGDECDMCVYNLRDGMLDIISGENYLNQPFSLVQVLLRAIS